jgi:hypothetical protein
MTALSEDDLPRSGLVLLLVTNRIKTHNKFSYYK